MAVLNIDTSVTANDTIVHAGFADFIKGAPGGSGANLFVSRSGKIQVINQWDINRDGYNDVLFSNDHNDYSVADALIYWNSKQGLTSLLPDLWREMPLAQVAFDLMDKRAGVTRLPAFGGGRSVIADLNRDGYPEIAFCNYLHNYPGVRTAYVYWGSQYGYAPERKTELPTQWAAGIAASDLNGDGYPELVLANFGFEQGADDLSRNRGRDSYIYWGSATGFNLEKPGLVPTRGAVDVAVADLNRDGHPDLAFINNSVTNQEVQIFWGNKAGYSVERAKSLPVPHPVSIRAGDLNGDGLADLIVGTAISPNPGTPSAGDDGGRPLEHSAYLIFGQKDESVHQSMVKLPAFEVRDSVVGDFNRDGFADIALANTTDGTKNAISSLVYWGSAQGFSPSKRTELPTLGATGVTASDVNRDGHIDLIFGNSSDGGTDDVPSYIYWGSSTGFAPYLRSSLQGFGVAGVSAADLNGDGRDEVLLVNRYSRSTFARVNTQIYWGNPHHYFSTASMTSLPGQGAYDTTVADLNDDGFNDLVISNAYAEESYLYWGSADGFSVSRRTSLPVGGELVSAAVDLNRDGFLDLLFSGTRSTATIFWGSTEGYSRGKMSVLKLEKGRSTSNVVADLNRDGYLDLVFQHSYGGNLQILWGGTDGYSEARTWSRFLGGGTLELADLNGDGFLDFIITGLFDPKHHSYNARTKIFLGTSDGLPSAEPSAELEAYGACEVAVSDLNRDGVLDLVLSNYKSDSTRSLPLFIYWGNQGGLYSNTRRTELPAESSCGVQTLDLNRDGYPEVIIHNHLKDARHAISSYIYWNGPQGFDKERRSELPTFGPHYSQWTDPGNLYTRKLEEEYTSPPVQLLGGRKWHALRWSGEEPHGSKLKFQVRAAGSRQELSGAQWRGPGGSNTFYETPEKIADLNGVGDGWLQYRAVFTSIDAGEWPTLSKVEIESR